MPFFSFFSFPTFALLFLDEVDVLVDVPDGLTREVRVAVGKESCLSSDVLLAKYDVVEPATKRCVVEVHVSCLLLYSPSTYRR